MPRQNTTEHEEHGRSIREGRRSMTLSDQPWTMAVRRDPFHRGASEPYYWAIRDCYDEPIVFGRAETYETAVEAIEIELRKRRASGQAETPTP